MNQICSHPIIDCSLHLRKGRTEGGREGGRERGREGGEWRMEGVGERDHDLRDILVLLADEPET